MHFSQFRLAIHRIAVDVDLAIEAMQIAFGSNYQRVDFEER